MSYYYPPGSILPGFGDPETWPAYSGNANDPRGPGRDAQLQRELDRKAENAASDGFDSLDDRAREWLEDQASGDILSILLAIRPDESEEIERARLRLRERFIQECADLYFYVAEPDCEPDYDE